MVRKTPEWISDLRQTLVNLMVPGHGWAYGREGPPCTEPTALACLALQKAAGGRDSFAVDTGLRWLASIQQPNGAMGISESLPAPEWATPYAVLAWAKEKRHAQNAQRACDWLLGRTGLAYRDESKVFGHDTTIEGWPWNAGTHSWVEPTAIAVLALRRQGLGSHARTLEGLRLIGDRAVPTGGWNYGNSTVYGTALRPQPAATGLALVALSGSRAADDAISSACAYLEGTVAGLRAPQSLCWALLGLAAWGRRPAGAGRWLEQAYERVLQRGPNPPQVAHLLLAAGADSLRLLGVQPDSSERNL